jgi:NAD(P)H-flavin reductase
MVKFFSLLFLAANVCAFSPLPNTFTADRVALSKASTAAFGPTHEVLIRKTLGHSGVKPLFMGWGPEPIWSTAEVLSNEVACPSGSSVLLSVAVPAEAMEEYKIPGQYVQMRVHGDEDAKPIFLAIASPPKKEGEDGDAVMEFLIKKTDSNDWITSASASTSVAVSQVLGSGFPMEENIEGFKFDFPCQNVLLFANGSGIAPIRAAIESGLLNVATPGGGGRTARLYYGVTSPSDMAYADKFAKWELSGVEVVPVVSRPEECVQEWPGRTGYVQNALEEDGVPIPRNSAALLCGVKGMAESVKACLTKSGVFEERVLTNF